MAERVQRHGLEPSSEAWDFLSLALSAVTVDGIHRRNLSADGWTRQLDLSIAAVDPDRWNDVGGEIARALSFLTTDIWSVSFMPGGQLPRRPRKHAPPKADAVALLSGGLDSLIGTIDLASGGSAILGVSQTVRGDSHRQKLFARRMGQNVQLIQLNHNASTRRREKETSQRARSMVFIAFAVLAASTLDKYKSGATIPIYICENGFIAINPPLTLARIGSLSTRTAHPHFLSQIQHIFDKVGLRVKIINPYEEKTKGEMMLECRDQDILQELATVSTSCGRFQRFNYTHCGRCVPCQIRRASFLTWDGPDQTKYHFEDLSIADSDYAMFDDVQAVKIALETAESYGLDRWIGNALNSPHIDNALALRAMLGRGLQELRTLHENLRIP
ncbi:MULTISPECIES: Qat anti-phage system QueC-like protein QatC [unclassified Arthrobacter]|uniref:Qat anti-phage system QueC-like protein QatC n=1 Tax=unclassified Arthrobacter TaxID=235627 RepID=UPI001C616579|nr:MULTISPECIES: Qat anti-phage system QueC-like protein QatC [unclassified Arthrobacter]